jgi:hypothetical protein
LLSLTQTVLQVYKKIGLFILSACLVVHSFPQAVYQHVSNKQVYEFLDELAILGIIELNTVIKPFSRNLIAEKLHEADMKRDNLNERQKADLDFYLKDYNKELLPGRDYKKRLDMFYYKDSLFTISVNPILGIRFWNSQNGSNYHRWNGGEVFAYAGNHLGFYASLRDNHEDVILSDPVYLDRRAGAKYKSGQDYSEMRGGVTWSWKWGTIGLVKDHFEWGNYTSYPNIFSAKPPSMAHIKINMKPVKWFEFNYIHAWLVSEVVDSSRSYYFTNSYGTNYREIFYQKYLSANMFTFIPFKGLYVSVGNSIIYSDNGLQPAYMIPVFFYKSVDHTLGGANTNYAGQNSQLFFDISVKMINHLHFWFTALYDDLAVSRFFKDDEWNFYSIKGGIQVSNPVPNLFFSAEFLRTNPLVFKHNMPTTTFESNLYNLGHYLQDNSLNYYFDIAWKPVRGMKLMLYYNFARHGPDHNSLGTKRTGIPFMETVEWEQQQFGFRADYQPLNDLFVFFEAVSSHTTGDQEKYTTPVFRGDITVISLGANIGF